MPRQKVENKVNDNTTPLRLSKETIAILKAEKCKRRELGEQVYERGLAESAIKKCYGGNENE